MRKNLYYKMGGNTNNGYRKGAVKERTQEYLQDTKQYVKKDTITNKIIEVSDKKFKGVTLKK
jgi:hypothetical protein